MSKWRITEILISCRSLAFFRVVPMGRKLTKFCTHVRHCHRYSGTGTRTRAWPTGSTAPPNDVSSRGRHILWATCTKFAGCVGLLKTNNFCMYIALATPNRKWGNRGSMRLDTWCILTNSSDTVCRIIVKFGIHEAKMLLMLNCEGIFDMS